MINFIVENSWKLYFVMMLVIALIQIVGIIFAIIIPPFRRLIVKIVYIFYKWLYIELLVNALGDLFTPEEFEDFKDTLDELKESLSSSIKEEKKSEDDKSEEKEKFVYVVKRATVDFPFVFEHELDAGTCYWRLKELHPDEEIRRWKCKVRDNYGYEIVKNDDDEE